MKYNLTLTIRHTFYSGFLFDIALKIISKSLILLKITDFSFPKLIIALKISYMCREKIFLNMKSSLRISRQIAEFASYSLKIRFVAIKIDFN